MDYYKDLENLCNVLSEQISEVSRKTKNGMSAGDLEMIDKLTHSLASVKKIMAFMDDEGEYSDLRQFKDIKITKKTTIDTVASNTDESMLNIDQDGDGKYDLRLRAQNNSVAEEIPLYVNSWIKYIIIAALILILLDIIAIVLYLRSKRRGR